MSKRWIFQDIKDAQEQVLYRTSSEKPMTEMLNNVSAYHARLREEVIPETYVRYELHLCDIYVDVEYILAQTTAIYGDKVSREQILDWIRQHKEPHHLLQ